MITSFVYSFITRIITRCHVSQRALKKVVSVVALCCFGCLTINVLGGCAQQDEWDSDQVGNFEALWTIMDEHYSFFDYNRWTGTRCTTATAPASPTR